MNARGQKISHPFSTAPEATAPLEVAPGIHWVKVTLDMPPGHVNALVLDDGDGWTIVDPGMDRPGTRALWTALLAGRFAGKPVRRVLITHHHVDHLGLAGWFTARGAELLMTRTAWLTARSQYHDRQEIHGEEVLTFWRRGGLPQEEIARRQAEGPWNLSDHAMPLPPTYRRLVEDTTLRLGQRDWIIRSGHGHAPEHATLWSDGIVIGGDQLLPGISPNLGVWPSEPEADPVGEWLASCRRLSAFATPDQLVLPGHKLPYRGLPWRLAALETNHVAALDRLEERLATTPARAVDCFPILFGRQIGPSQMGLALAEAVGHLNHLHHRGRASRELDEEDAWLWRA